MKFLRIVLLTTFALAWAAPTNAAGPTAPIVDTAAVAALLGSGLAAPAMPTNRTERPARLQQAACFCKRYESVCERLIIGTDKCLKWVRKCQEYDSDC